MKRMMTGGLLALCLTATAQSLHVKSGQTVYAFRADDLGEMNFEANGGRVCVMGHWFDVDCVDYIVTDPSEVADGVVLVDYAADGPHVTVAGDLADYVEVTVEGAHVAVTQADNVGEATCGEITYRLSGQAADGGFLLTGSYKARIELAGLSLTNPAGPALDIQNGKRIELSVGSGTENTLADGVGGDWKGCIACKGHLELKGKGTLNVRGNTNHAVYAKEYVTVKNCTLNVLGAVADGVNCNQYFTLESGTLSIAAVGDDGVQVSFKDATDREAEDTGSLTVAGGTLTADVPAASVKGLKAEGDVLIAGGDVTVTAKGSGSEGIESKQTLTVSGGRVTVTAHDDALNSGRDMYLQGGNIVAMAANNDGIDSNGNLYITGGTVLALGAGGAECGFDVNDESGCQLYLTGGTVLGVGGRNASPASSGSDRQAYVSGSQTVTAGSAVTLLDGGSQLAAFTVPDSYGSSSSWNNGPNWGPGGGGGNNRPGMGGGSTGGGLLLSCPGLTQGSSYTLTVGSASAAVTAQ